MLVVQVMPISCVEGEIRVVVFLIRKFHGINVFHSVEFE